MAERRVTACFVLFMVEAAMRTAPGPSPSAVRALAVTGRTRFDAAMGRVCGAFDAAVSQRPLARRSAEDRTSVITVNCRPPSA